MLRIPRHPFRMARFGLAAMQPAHMLARRFSGPRARALFAGIAAHSFLSFDEPFSSAIGIVLGAAAHAVGWPVPRGGAGSITRALIAHLHTLGSKLHTNRRIDAQGFREVAPAGTLTLCDVSPRQLVALAADRLPPATRRAYQRFKPGPGCFKIDYALNEPVPWRAADCRRAICLHLGGSFEQIAASEDAVAHGRHAERPYILIAQPTLFDPTRAPAGKHTLWAYCHVPNGSAVDMTARIENEIERFAPGFRDCILARHVSPPAELERMNANLLGGDISGGAMNLGQLIFRPTTHYYATGSPGLYLCSSSTPPGGAVHGMCGYHAAARALRQLTANSIQWSVVS
jgi:phytoene dehydrogenase-like protein